MSVRIAHLTVDCDDAGVVAGFWSAALDHPLDTQNAAPAREFATVGVYGPDRLTPGWMFIRVPEGKSVKNRVHPDLVADDREAEVDRLVGLGATRVGDF